MKQIRSTVHILGLLLLPVLVLAGSQAVSGASHPAQPLADFDGDGVADLVVGAAYEDIGTANAAGAVQVLFGDAAGGLSGDGDQYFSEDQSGLTGAAEAEDHFGNALAAGDFDGDGLMDLAIGVPGQDVNAIPGAGAVHVLYGTEPGGLGLDGDQVWHQDVGIIHSLCEEYDHFGQVLTAGDFDGDGYDDLVVGVPDEKWNEVESGIVQVLYGTASGLSDVNNQLWRQGADGIPGEEETEEHFGGALSAGDFDGDGYDDLAIGVAGEVIDTKYDAGAVHVLYGTVSGLTATGNQYLYQDMVTLLGSSEGGDRFGNALAAGDFDGDGYADLAVGVRGQDVVNQDLLEINQAGAVHVLYGSYQTGLTGDGDQIWHQEVGAIQSIAETYDQFGFTLAAGNLNGDLYCDLAVGVPYEDWYIENGNAGIVQVLYGTANGLNDTGNQLWRQGDSGILDSEESGDLFGYTLAIGDYNHDGYGDLAVGVPLEDLESIVDAGMVHILLGSASGLTNVGNQIWYQGYEGLQGVSETGDYFGWSLASIPPVIHRTNLPLVYR
jgi:hypothetical protein